MSFSGPPQRITIIGGGAFGLSTALALSRGPYKGKGDLITVLDRSASPPAKDAASSDLNKIVRSDYSSALYTTLAQRSLKVWNTSGWSSYYHESGVVVQGSSPHSGTYVSTSLAHNPHASSLSPEGVKALFGCSVNLEEGTAYLNPVGGWADASGAMQHIYELVRGEGVRFEVAIVREISTLEGKVSVDGLQRRLEDDELVILSAGSWSSSLFPALLEEKKAVSTAQVIGTISLTPEEVERYSKNPVYLSFDNGFYAFPPTKSGEVKFAIHGEGFVTKEKKRPVREEEMGTLGKDRLTEDGRKTLKTAMETVFPDFKGREWSGERLCWYMDAEDEDWIISYSPKSPNLFIATGDSGHAFKFLPILGELVLSALKGELEEEQKELWAWEKVRRSAGVTEESREKIGGWGIIDV
ncbi:FAD dependent oxidoreductase [Atractiella rhizophila]|nr:FAD dependent oxidoreductase [Atractiella rhizophila]